MATFTQYVVAAVLSHFGIGGETEGVTTTGRMDTVIEERICPERLPEEILNAPEVFLYPCKDYTPQDNC